MNLKWILALLAAASLSWASTNGGTNVVQESEPADRVYQMNLQLFPMAQSTPRRV